MISVKQNSNSILIRIDADIYNSSSQNFNLFSLRSSIEKQLQRVFHVSVGRYAVDIQLAIRCVYKMNQLSSKRILFQIVDAIAGNNPAEADFKGLRIKLNKNHLSDIIENRNVRTIPHEVGHLFGWDHPHARAQYESINPEAHPLEQQLSESERKINLMSQTWYAQRAGISLEKAMSLTERQIELLIQNSGKNLLNNNRHLRGFFFWKEIISH